MLAGRGEQKASWEGEFGQMEALPAMEMGACGQYGQDSAPGFPAEDRSMYGTAGREGLMAFKGPLGDPGSLALQTCSPHCCCHSHRKLLSTSELLIPHIKCG